MESKCYRCGGDSRLPVQITIKIGDIRVIPSVAMCDTCISRLLQSLNEVTQEELVGRIIGDKP